MRRLLKLLGQTGKRRDSGIKRESLRMTPITMQEQKRSIGERKRRDRARFITPLEYIKSEAVAA